jgi:phage-related tail fiber protein
MANVVISGDTSGAITLAAPAVAGTTTLTLPTTSGTVLTSNSAFTGEVAFFAMNTAPTGWIKANGATVSRTTYAALFAAIGTTFGAGDGSTNFVIPDLRGYFPRGWVDDGSIDSGRAFGSTQTDAMQGHKHAMDNSGPFGVPFPAGGLQSSGGGAAFQNAAVGNPSTDGTNGTPRTASETRPTNIALLACIKF